MQIRRLCLDGQWSLTVFNSKMPPYWRNSISIKLWFFSYILKNQAGIFRFTHTHTHTKAILEKLCFRDKIMQLNTDVVQVESEPQVSDFQLSGKIITNPIFHLFHVYTVNWIKKNWCFHPLQTKIWWSNSLWVLTWEARSDTLSTFSFFNYQTEY